MSKALAPRSPCSSATVRSSSIPTGGVLSTPRWTSSMKTATAALLSAPRIVSPALRKTPSSLTTSTRPLCGTVSICAQNITYSSRSPATRASRFPAPASAGPAASSSSTSSPSARSSAAKRVGDLALLTGRRPDLAEPRKGVVKPLVPRHREQASGGAPGRSGAAGCERLMPMSMPSPSRSTISPPSAGFSPAWVAAAPTNSRKSGSGRFGRELNSGWNWEAT